MIIAVLGFVAPAITLLIGIFTEGIDKHRKRNVEKVRHLDNLMSQSHKKIKGQTQDSRNTVLESFKKHNVQKLKAQRDINLLSPKRQVIRIFGSLILSILMLLVYYILRLPHFNTDMFLYKSISVVFSLFFFEYSIFSLWQIFCMIIDLKAIDSKEYFSSLPLAEKGD